MPDEPVASGTEERLEAAFDSDAIVATGFLALSRPYEEVIVPCLLAPKLH
jgi:hypothetical protein